MAFKVALEESHEPLSETGPYVTVRGEGTTVTEAVEVDSPDVTTLAAGAPVYVLEVMRRDDARRVRGRIATPAGWISLEDLDTGYRWVAPAPGSAPAMALR